MFVPRRARAVLLLCSLAFVAGVVRAVGQWLPRGERAAWIDQPGIPVELAGDGVYFLAPPATTTALLRRADHRCAVVGEPGRALSPGDRVTVPTSGCRIAVDRMAGAARLTLGLRLDVNRDDADALSALPHVGPGLARAIVRDRERRGPFRDVADLERVTGLGPATLRAIRAHVMASASAGPGD